MLMQINFNLDSIDSFVCIHSQALFNGHKLLVNRKSEALKIKQAQSNVKKIID